MEEVTNLSEYDTQIHKNSHVILYFWADWHEASKPGGQMYEILEALSLKYKSVKFVKVEAENASDVSSKFGVTMVPTFIALLSGKIIGKVEGANPPEVSQLVKKLSTSDVKIPTTESSTQPEENLNTKLDKLIRSSPVMLFMKGNPETPRCGFSRQIVEILQSEKVPFSTFDILTDNIVREGLKVYSEWPTYPQLYVNGELVGGLDIVKEMVANGTPLLDSLGITSLKIPNKEDTLNTRIKELINQDTVMLFMKGSPSQPKCGFSRTIVEILNTENIKFSSFDILTDEDIRQQLKVYSDWPTYPQLYVKGELVGGLDIIKEMQCQGSLSTQLSI